MISRNIEPILREALSASRIVFLNGARQAGKTTLARHLAAEIGADYQTLDDRAARVLALDDPDEFVDRERPLVIDEVQRGGEDLLLAIKARVDGDPRPGRFLLTGSTRFLSVPTLSESLAGRLDLVDMWPLSQGEIERRRDAFIDRVFGTTRSLRQASIPVCSREDAFERVCRGGFPEAVSRNTATRARWFDGYLRTLTGRDVGHVANIQRVQDLPALVRLLASCTGSALNISRLANDAKLPRTTLGGYLPLLEAVFLVFRLRAWSRNLTSKSVKQAKLHFTDSGLAAHLIGATPPSLVRRDNAMAGALLESFAVSEIARQRSWANSAPELYHFRDRSGAEVDLVLEARDGRVAAVEVKAGRSVGRNDLRGLTLLRDRVGSAFANGVVVGTFGQVQPLGDRLTALPISALWA